LTTDQISTLPKAQLCCAWFQDLGRESELSKKKKDPVAQSDVGTDDFILSIHISQLFCDLLGAIRARVVDYYDFPVKFTRFLFEKIRGSVIGKRSTHFPVNTFARSQMMMGKFLRSLYVGRMTEYLWVLGVIRMFAVRAFSNGFMTEPGQTATYNLN
jgi:hypothetical protein